MTEGRPPIRQRRGDQTVTGPAGDVATLVVGQGQGDVQQEATFDVLAIGNTFQDLHPHAAVEGLLQHDQALQEVVGETVDLHDGDHVTLAQLRQGRGQPWSPPSELAEHLFLEDPPADR